MASMDLGRNAFSGSVPAEWSDWSLVRKSPPSYAGSCHNVMQNIVNTQCMCVQLQYLNLGGNQLSGTVPYMPLTGLGVLNVSSNKFTDPRLDAVPPWLQLLYLANNSLTGNILSLGGQTTSELILLDLSYNNLEGSLPEDMPFNLSILNISNNALTGSLPSSWSSLKNMAELRLDNNQFKGTLPASWSAWGNSTSNSIQLSMTNASLHGRMPRQWVEQFCLDIVKTENASVLFAPIQVVDMDGFSPLRYGNISAGPLIELLAQRASINVTLASKTYTFDYDNPDSVCGIPYAVRNTALLWSSFATLLLATVIFVFWWQKRKPKPGAHAAWLRGWRISTVLSHDKVHFGRRVATCVWFLVSDVGWTIYSQVTDAITIHQVVASKQLRYAYILLAILLVPFAVMFILVVRVSITMCCEKVVSRSLIHRAAAPLSGLLLAPVLFVGLQLMLILHGVGIPLPAWWGSLGIDLGTFCRMQSVAEAVFSALPQSIVQTKLYLMGNDPRGVHVYIDTSLFLTSVVASLFSVLKTVALIAIELHQYGYTLFGYGWALIKFDSFPNLP